LSVSGTDDSKAAVSDKNITPPSNVFAYSNPFRDFPDPPHPNMSRITGALSTFVASSTRALLALSAGIFDFCSAIADHIVNASLDTLVTIAEIGAVTLSVTINPHHMTHFTWWALAIYVAYQGIRVGYPTFSPLLWAVSFVVSTVVVLGVVLLSVARCRMLDETLADIGASAYLVGNFAVHYWPWLRLYFLPDRAKCTTFASQAIFALTFPIVYVATTPAGSVYGCAVSERAVSAISVSGILAVGASYYMFCRKHGRPNTTF
jgi:hypothetical protein